MTQSETFDRLRLIRSTNIGPVSYVQLLRRFGSAAAALDAFPELAKRGGSRAPRIADHAAVEQEIAAVQSLGAQFLFLGDAGYPALLHELSNAPPVLIWRGDIGLLKGPSVAIVGARNASAAACKFARQLASDLSTGGTRIVSGLARGVDTAAHQGSLKNGTIAVVAGGIDVIFPPENADLQEQVACSGLLLSEQPPGTEPRARHFPFRNRIIAGLARGTLVIEAAPRSGSLITARLAGEAGRHVMAIPGSPLDPRSRGCNGLIREGATLVQSADDVTELIRSFDDRIQPEDKNYSQKGDQQDFNYLKEDGPAESADLQIGSSDRKNIIDLLSITPVLVDELIRQSGLPAAAVQTILLELELAGRLTRHAAGRVGRSG